MSFHTPSNAAKYLTQGEIEKFVDDGCLLLSDVFDRRLAQSIVPLVWNEMTERPDKPDTWTQPIRIVEKVLQDIPIDGILNERYRGCLDDLCGEGRWETNLGVGYWVNLFPEAPSPNRRPQQVDWHLDIKTDWRDLNSAELGLTAMEFFTDVDAGGGGTALRIGSHRYVARLAQHNNFALTADQLSSRAFELTHHLPEVCVTARAGDVLLMHPFLLHASSSNISQRVRIAANRPVSLFEPINFHRSDPDSYSVIEQAVVRALEESV